MRPITAMDGLEFERGSAVVCVLTSTKDESTFAEQQAIATASSVMESVDPSIPVLIAGTAAQIGRIEAELSVQICDRTTLSLALEPGANLTQAVNAAARASFPSDFVLVTAGMRVASSWLKRLRAAATSDSTVASATPLSLGGGALQISDGDQAAASRIEELAQRLSDRGLQLRPRIVTMGPGCVYVRRAALEVVDPLNEALALDRALADLAMRAIAAGMVHVAADDVLVDGSLSPRAADKQESGGGLEIDDQVQETIASDERGRLHRALAVARMALRRLSVTVDGRALTSMVGGTQTYIIDLILALARQQDLAVRVLVTHDLSERAADALATLSDVELLTYEQALSSPRLTDVVHRPQSVFTPEDLALLRLLGERVVIGQHDLISYHNYSYHRDVDSWRAYRRTTRLALAAADQVIFFSEHARRDALAEDLVPEARTHVVGVGAEVLGLTSALGAPPDGLSEGDPFLLCLGADYSHKNRLFAIELLDGLRELGWMGRLVLAGAHVPFGSSHQGEHELSRSRPDLAEFIVDLGPVDEAAKTWLYRHARALVYPTLYEGLGLLPLEAARAGLPCLFAPQASLAEVAGKAATLVPWDAGASASAVLPLLTDGPARDRHLAELCSLSLPDWAEVGGQLVAVYQQAFEEPPSEAAPRSWQELDREKYIVRLDQEVRHLKAVAQEYQDAYHELEGRVSFGLPLIDDGGLLSQAQQRGLMRIAARRRLGALLFAPLGLVGRR